MCLTLHHWLYRVLVSVVTEPLSFAHATVEPVYLNIGVQLQIVSLLTEGPCVGLVEVLTVGYGQACSMDFGGPEASVVCRQVGCGPFGARRVSADL